MSSRTGKNRIYSADPWLKPYAEIVERRNCAIFERKERIAGKGGRLASAANGHLYYCPHREDDCYVFREWAPNASRIYVIGDFNGWRRSEEWAMRPSGDGNWELAVNGDSVHHGDLFKWFVEWPGGGGERIPAYAVRCIQDPETKLFAAQIWEPREKYLWRSRKHVAVKKPLIYEVHIGMSSEQQKVAGFEDFRKNVLPHIVDMGYNTIQIMALQEHPYYGSFGYQVSSFFALSSRFGTPEEFKKLVDEAHAAGLSVVMDLVHSHAVSNENEGLSCIDGSYSTYFHEGERGWHPAWGSRCFNYGSDKVAHFLLSNIKYWMEEYRLDGFRFDGVTSMLYLDHGLERDFVGYDAYFDGAQDEDAITYLGLANILVKELYRNGVTIAEDMSGMAGLAAPLSRGGIGFDYRMSMGVADHWIKWIKERTDWEWSMGEIFFELSGKRDDEKTISYAECHDQALVGDKTLIFRLLDKEMYTGMSKTVQSLTVDRGVALHKMIRLATISTAGDGYLTFMGNEFGHPEWIDFPREGNGWSYFYARRQWHLAEDPLLRYCDLMQFDKAMIELFADNDLFPEKPVCLRVDEEKKVLVIGRGVFIFAFNFNPQHSFEHFAVQTCPGDYSVVLDSDSSVFGGFDRNDCNALHITKFEKGANNLYLYLPCRSAQVLKKI